MRINVREFDGTRDWGWFTSRTPIKRVEDTCGLVAENEETGDTLAIMVCDTWYDNSVHLHLCVDDSVVARHGFIEKAFDYVFKNPEHPNTQIAYGFVPTKNIKAMKLNKNLGFERVCTLSGGATGEGFHILTMKKEECKFLKGV